MAVSNALIGRLHAEVVVGDRAGQRDLRQHASDRAARSKKVAMKDKASAIDTAFTMGIVRAGVAFASSVASTGMAGLVRAEQAATQPAAQAASAQAEGAKAGAEQAAKAGASPPDAAGAARSVEGRGQGEGVTWADIQQGWSKLNSYYGLAERFLSDDVKTPIESAARERAARTSEAAQASAQTANRIAGDAKGADGEANAVGGMLRDLIA